MWLALYLTALQGSLAALGLGCAGLPAGEQDSDGKARGPRPPRGYWIFLGLACQTLAFAGLFGAARRFGGELTIWLAAGGALLWFFWLGAWLRQRVMFGGLDAPGAQPWLPWKILLLLGEIALTLVSAGLLGAYFTEPEQALMSPGWIALVTAARAASIAMSLFLGVLLLFFVLYWLRALARLPGEREAGEVHFSPRLLGMTILLFIFYRAGAIAFSLWAGAHFNPISPTFFLETLLRTGAPLIFLRWLLGITLPTGVALTMMLDPERTPVGVVRMQLMLLLVLLVLAELLSGGLIIGAGGLAI